MHDNKVLERFTCTAAALLLLLPAAGLCCGSPWGLLPRGLEMCGGAVVLRMKASLTQNKLTGITLKKITTRRTVGCTGKGSSQTYNRPT